jgi:hypothetical protein
MLCSGRQAGLNDENAADKVAGRMRAPVGEMIRPGWIAQVVGLTLCLAACDCAQRESPEEHRPAQGSHAHSRDELLAEFARLASERARCQSDEECVLYTEDNLAVVPCPPYLKKNQDRQKLDQLRKKIGTVEPEHYKCKASGARRGVALRCVALRCVALTWLRPIGMRRAVALLAGPRVHNGRRNAEPVRHVGSRRQNNGARMTTTEPMTRWAMVWPFLIVGAALPVWQSRPLFGNRDRRLRG